MFDFHFYIFYYYFIIILPISTCFINQELFVKFHIFKFRQKD